MKPEPTATTGPAEDATGPATAAAGPAEDATGPATAAAGPAEAATAPATTATSPAETAPATTATAPATTATSPAETATAPATTATSPAEDGTGPATAAAGPAETTTAPATTATSPAGAAGTSATAVTGGHAAVGTLAVTGSVEADRLLNTSPLALLLGMLLDQQIPLEWAFKGPHRLAERLGSGLDAQAISEHDPDDFAALVSAKPALHRFPASMAKRMQALCQHLVDDYDADAGALWADAATGEELMERLRALPGYGDEKAKILMAVLAKRFGVQPRGWREQAAPFSDNEPRSVADIDSPEALQRVRSWKRAKKAAGLGKGQ